MGVLGVRVLGEGLPELPDVLTHAMTIPVAYWTSTTCAAVLFLGYSQDPETGDFQPEGFFPTFFLDGTTWQPHDYLYGYGWSHDFIATSESLRDLDGRAIVTAGRSVSIIRRRASPPLSSRVGSRRRSWRFHCFKGERWCADPSVIILVPGWSASRTEGRTASRSTTRRARWWGVLTGNPSFPVCHRDAGGTDDGLRREEHDHGQPSSGHSSCLSCPSTCDDSISFRAGTRRRHFAPKHHLQAFGPSNDAGRASLAQRPWMQSPTSRWPPSCAATRVRLQSR